MKRILLIIALIAPLIVNAQDAKSLKPVYFPSGQIAGIDSFNEFILSAIPDFHLATLDTLGTGTWYFTFTNNEIYNNIKNILKINYELQVVSGNASMHISLKYGMADIDISGEFLTMNKIYNKIFNQDFSPEEFHKKTEIHGPLSYKGYKYWFNYGIDSRGIYYMRFAKK